MAYFREAKHRVLLVASQIDGRIVSRGISGDDEAAAWPSPNMKLNRKERREHKEPNSFLRSLRLNQSVS
jgi:hypothetical protein